MLAITPVSHVKPSGGVEPPLLLYESRVLAIPLTRHYKAGDGIRTRDPFLTKEVRYHYATPANQEDWI